MMGERKATVQVLSSCLGYGVYYPAVMVSNALRSAGFHTHLYVIEHYYNAQKKETFRQTRNAFRKNFALAQLASRWPTNYSDGIDEREIEAVMGEWNSTGSNYFLLFSATWLPVLKAYQHKYGADIVVDVCKIDAGLSTVWKQPGIDVLPFSTHHLFDPGRKRVNFTIHNGHFYPKSFSDREQAVVMHGGGWGLGSYIEKSRELASCGFKRNVIIHDSREVSYSENVRYYMNDPSWDLLDISPDECFFPPFSMPFSSADIIRFEPQRYYPGIYQVINNSKAIIAKAGGMTLLDSLITRTPLVFLEPMGDNEATNASLWSAMGMAVSFEEWQQCNFDEAVLARLEKNIASNSYELQDFSAFYLNSVFNI